MESFSAETFAATLALVGMVIVVAALLSGWIERSGLPQVAVFLALGASLGPSGLGLLDVTLDSPILRIVATLSLALVLFTDAVTLNIAEVRRHRNLALRVLGPGTLSSAALIAAAGWWLLGLSPPAAAILGAALASTDPVLLRAIVRRRDLSSTARQALRLESGLNDVALLPVVLVAMGFLQPRGEDNGWGQLAIQLFILGPAAGVAVGLLGVATLDMVRRRVGVRRDYESLYSLGIALTAFAAAESVHSSGFLAAFAAGLTITALDVELCDCFLEYGEATAEMALLFTFVLFGSSLIWSGFTVLSGATLLFAAAVLAARPLAFFPALAGTRLDRRGRVLIAWFGTRGLSSLLLVLLPIFGGVPGSRELFAICCLVVLVSVVLHGGSSMLLGRGSADETQTLPESDTAPRFAPAATIAPPELGGDGQAAQAPRPGRDGRARPVVILPRPDAEGGDGAAEDEPRADPDRISLEEVRQLVDSGEQVVILDVRTDRTYDGSPSRAAGAARLPPDHVVERATELGLPRDAWVVGYCT